MPIFKKGNSNLPDNYRGISLGSVISKVYTYILGERLTEWTEREEEIIEEQAGFRKNYSCADQIYSLYSMVHRQFSKNRKLYVAFVDFRKAFDLVNRNALWHVLQKSGLPKNSKTFKAIQSI